MSLTLTTTPIFANVRKTSIGQVTTHPENAMIIVLEYALVSRVKSIVKRVIYRTIGPNEVALASGSPALTGKRGCSAP